MNALGERVLLVTKEFLGPAAQQFLSKELRALACTADTITPTQLSALSEHAQSSAQRIMDGGRAAELAQRLLALGAGAEPSVARATVPVKDVGAPRLALDAAAKLLASGKLRQAEEAYRQLAQKHGDARAYRGLADTQVALEDVGAAVLALRDGAAALARKGDRAEAIGLLVDAVGIAPADLAAHRRLAAAHANAGDAVAACAEYERFVAYAMAEGDSRRAWLELTYARETLGDLPGLVRIVDRLMPGAPDLRRPAAPAPIVSPAPIVVPAPLPLRAATAAPVTPEHPQVRRLVPADPAPQRIAADEIPRTRPVGSTSAMVMADALTLTSVDALDEAPVDLAARIAPRSKEAQRTASQLAWKSRPPVDIEASLAALTPGPSPETAAASAAIRATILIGARDGRATEAALDAARRLLSLHKLQAASDLLLDLIAAGYTDREAQRLLIEVDCGLGRRDVARDKCHLLSAAYRLDGRVDTADDVERLAAIL